MAQTKQILIKDLSLDLNNFRTVQQPNEVEAVKAMISISPDRFWGLMDSLLEDGYLPTENIICIKDSSGKLIVKEGNRRIAVLKLAYDIIENTKITMPANVRAKVAAVNNAWKLANKKVPCTIFEATDRILVDKVVTMAHGKGEKASRDPWASIAKARHNRDVNHATEPGLDLLEKYLQQGRNINAQQKERFGGDYPISILDAAIAKIATRLGAANPTDLATKYPNLTHVDALESLLLEIGQRLVSFEIIRSTVDFALKYGIPPIVPPTPPTPTPTPTASPAPPTPSITPSPGTGPGTGTTNSTPTPPTPPAPPPTPAAATTTSKSVMNKLTLFNPIGANRDKVVTLRNEILRLDISKTPIAFCFLLRSMFEISVKVYLTENGKSLTKPSGQDKYLITLLTEAKDHIISLKPGMSKPLHGAVTELGKTDGLLSVTSMNQLVHNISFSVNASDICGLFHNIYPMLEAMN